MPAKKNEKEKTVVEIVVCSECKGNKIINQGIKCSACRGMGVFMRAGKSAIYHWQDNLLGFSPIFRSIYEIFPKIAHFVVYILIFIAFGYGIYFVVINNLNIVELIKNDIVEEEENWMSVVLAIALRFLKAPIVLIDHRGTGPLVFWMSNIGIMYAYYYFTVKNLSKKKIDLASSDFNIFLNNKAKEPDEPVNIADYMSPAAKHALASALDISHGLKQAPSVYHLAKTIARDPEIGALFKRLEINVKEFVADMDVFIGNLPKDGCYRQGSVFRCTIMGPNIEKIIIFAFREALIMGMNNIEIDSLFSALFGDETLNKYFRDKKIEVDDVRHTILWVKGWSKKKIRLKRSRKIGHSIMNRAWTARVTPELDRFSYDLTDHARSGLTGYIVDREEKLDSLMRILERTSKNNALLIGEEGSGRASIVKKLANRMIKDHVLPTLQDKRLVVLDIGSLVSGAKAGGDLELRIMEIMQDMGKSGNIILYIPDIHNIAAAGSGAGFDASKVFSPILSQGIFQIIGSTDYRNYHRYIEPRSDFANNFDLIKVEELDEKNTMEILAIQAKIIEAREDIVMTYGAIKKAVELSKRYITDRLLPGKAIDLLSETAVEVRRTGPGSILRDKDIMEVITEKTGIPLTDISGSEAEKLLSLEKKLHERVIGQDGAVKEISSAIRRVRVGMKHKARPIGAFLFLGPTGVGKTELAKALAEVYYGDETAMIRVDMSEYQTIGSVEKLIGSSSDLSEATSGGILTEAVKRKPFSLVLLDELEKANKNVLNLFLQVFDDGRLTDNLGRTVDFTNTIIIATSNAGSQVIRKMVIDKESSNERIFQMLEPYLMQNFTPEFLNRFTAKVVFRSLTKNDIVAIAKLQIDNLAERLDKAQGIKVAISDEAMNKLADAGHSAEYGARFLQRTIQEKVENLIATKFLQGSIKRGDTFKIEAVDI